VRDRWSRYIGAMGVEAVKKQAESQVLLVGLGALGLEIAKNLVLSGLKRLTIVDNEKIRSHWEHFYMSDMPGELRSKCLFKLK
jgi:tRNA A37 threonylcarbamoyladenosine dehydratase